MADSTGLENVRLAAWMGERGMSAAELADAVNRAILTLTTQSGNVSGRTVFRWLSGENRWPQARQRRALEFVTGVPATELGFRPRGAARTDTAPEDPVRRRQFCGAATAAALPLLAGSSRPASVGTTDVARLRDQVEHLVEVDAERGGHGLEQVALTGAAEAHRLQQQAATQLVRQRLFSLTADFTTTAAWSLIDTGQYLDRAGQYLDSALTLAGLGQDPEMTMLVWNLRAMLARQRGDYPEAIAAAQAARATPAARRSPLHASLAHARTAVSHAHAGDRRAALRCLGRAEEALAKADPRRPTPTWIAFYGPAELNSLTAIVRDLTGDPAHAEAAAHQALAFLPASYRRNRAYTTARLALAQLHQGEIEQACATGSRVFTLMEGTPLRGRVRQLLGDFQRELTATGSPAGHEWADRYHTEWSR